MAFPAAMCYIGRERHRPEMIRKYKWWLIIGLCFLFISSLAYLKA